MQMTASVNGSAIVLHPSSPRAATGDAGSHAAYAIISAAIGQPASKNQPLPYVPTAFV